MNLARNSARNWLGTQCQDKGQTDPAFLFKNK